MRYKIHPILLVVLAFAVLLSAQAFAGNKDKVGTVAAPELLIPVGARDMSMGGSTLANTSGIEAMYWNPAGLAYAERGAVAMFSHLTYIGDIGVNYVAVAGTFGNFGTIGFDLKGLSIGDIPVTTEDFPDGTGGFVSPTFFTVGLHYSRMLSDRVSVGVTANFINEDLSEARVQATGFAFSAGVQYRNLGGIGGLDLGVAVKNVGPQMRFEGSGLLRGAELDDVTRGTGLVQILAQSSELPSTIEIGLAYTVNTGENNSLMLTGLFQNQNFSADQFKLGAEFEFNDLLYLRGGYVVAPDADQKALGNNAFIFGPSFGVGFNLDIGGVNVSADYGWRQSKFFENQNAFSIKLGF